MQLFAGSGMTVIAVMMLSSLIVGRRSMECCRGTVPVIVIAVV
jgi:hypothetical protein